MTATMVDEIVATFDALEADDDVGAVVVTGEPPAFCSGADVSSLGALAEGRHRRTSAARSTSIYEGFLRVPALAAADGRGGERAGGRRGHEPRARVRRPPRRRIGPVRHPVRADRHAPRRRPHVDARAGGRPAGRGRDGAVRRQVVAGAAAVAIGLAWACHPDDELVDAAADFAAGGARAPDPAPRPGQGRPCARPPGSPTSRPRSPPRSAIRRGRWARAGSATRPSSKQRH